MNHHYTLQRKPFMLHLDLDGGGCCCCLWYEVNYQLLGFPFYKERPRSTLLSDDKQNDVVKCR
ncbi:hypothetical protein Hanom_Chr11g01001111 [Helianthus anomalus]